MGDKILFVDDDKLALEIADALFRAQGIEILTAGDAMEALGLFRLNDIAVVVSDNYMPGITGLEFLAQLKDISPETVKILVTAYADLTCALAAINRSEVFRFVVKPWKNEELLSAVSEGVRRHHLLQSLRKDEEDVLRSLAQTIELKDPSTKGHCDRVAVLALLLADALHLPREVMREIKYGSWLHDCGKIGVSETILNGNGDLSEQEIATMRMHADWGADVAAKANLSRVAHNIIRYHHEKYNGSGYPTGLKGGDIPIEARIVAVADVFDALTNDRPYRRKYSAEETFAILRSMAGSALDPDLVMLFLSLAPVRRFQDSMTD
ncbi:MAG TPA: HD domain-containing phosphohydrolase [Geobacteraceae bacterium]|nr:HD domain-containing phosphohydrolase [Geobacteraceae bacterium]